jgi:hypothetical protein
MSKNVRFDSESAIIGYLSRFGHRFNVADKVMSVNGNPGLRQLGLIDHLRSKGWSIKRF